MRTAFFILGVAIVAFLLFGSSLMSGKAGAVSPEEFKKLIEKEDTFVLDVQVPEETHIAGTDAFVPYNNLEGGMNKLPVDKDTVIGVYCFTGAFSEQAAGDLRKMGYKNVYSLRGGVTAWKQRGYPMD